MQVKVASEKTKALTITTQRSLEQSVIPLVMDATLLRCSRKIKIIDITVDQRLTFKEHAREVAARACRKLSMILRVSDLLDEDGCLTL